MVSDTAAQAQELLDRVENSALRVGFHMNAKKTKCMVFNQQDEENIKTSLEAQFLKWFMISNILDHTLSVFIISALRTTNKNDFFVIKYF